MLVLGVHAQQGAAATGRRGRRGCPGAGRHGDGAPACRGAGPPGLLGVGLEGRRPGQVAARRGHRALPWRGAHPGTTHGPGGRLGASAASAQRSADGTVRVTLDAAGEPGGATVIEADEVLAATGRAPRTGDIGLESAGLVPGSWLDVDETLRVRGADGASLDGGWLYAAGDVTHLALLTHMGKYQGRICGDAIAARAAGREPTVTDLASGRWVPQVVFTV